MSPGTATPLEQRDKEVQEGGEGLRWGLRKWTHAEQSLGRVAVVNLERIQGEPQAPCRGQIDLLYSLFLVPKDRSSYRFPELSILF